MLQQSEVRGGEKNSSRDDSLQGNRTRPRRPASAASIMWVLVTDDRPDLPQRRSTTVHVSVTASLSRSIGKEVPS
jgi:hypothetical protein